MNKKCSYCQKYRHVVSECRTANRESGQNKGTSVANSIPPNFSAVQTSAGQMYMVDASTYHSYMAQSLINNSNSSNVWRYPLKRMSTIAMIKAMAVPTAI